MGIGRKQNPRGRVGKMESLASHYSETILTVIAREYGTMRHASKILAQHARTSHRTAEAWLAGRNVPTGANLLNLIGASEALAEALSEARANQKTERGK
jgi:hypothetical protein